MAFDASSMMISAGVILLAVTLIVAPVLLMPAARDAAAAQRYDTQARIWAAHLLLALLLGSAIIGAVRGLADVAQAGITLRSIGGFVVALPILLAVGSYAIIPFAVRIAYRARAANPDADALTHAISMACEQIGIRCPAFVVSTIPSLSPEVYGTWRRAYVVVPANTDRIFNALERAVGGSAAAALRDFVVNHEMAHLKEYDYALFTWLSVFLRVLMWVWWPAYGVYLIAGTLLSSSPFSIQRYGWTSHGIGLPLGVVGVLYLATLAIARDREDLADRRAFDALDQQRRDLVVSESSSMPAPFSVLLRMLSSASRSPFGLGFVFRRSQRGPEIVRVATGLFGRLYQRHESAADRVAALGKGAGAVLARQGEIENGVFAGLTLGVLVVVGEFFGYVLRLPAGSVNTWTMMLGAVMLGSTFMMAIPGADPTVLTFREFDRLLLRKCGVALLTSSSMLMVFMLPGITQSGAHFILMMSSAASTGAYAIGTLGALAFHANKKVSWPESAAFSISLRVIGSLVLVAVLGGGGLMTVACAAWAAADFPLPGRR